MAAVCEDHTHDQYIVRPVLQRLLSTAGKPHATVTVVMDPRLKGIDDLKRRACEVLKRYGAVADIVVFVVDADGLDGTGGMGNRQELLQRLVQKCEKYSERAFVVAAIQEVEVWALWGSRAQLGVEWKDVRAERHPKERFFEPLVTSADQRTPGRGRVRLIEKSLTNWGSLAGGCPELGEFASAVQSLLQ